MIDLLKSLPDGNPRIRLSDGFRKDLQWWTDFSRVFNGKAHVIHNDSSDSPHVYTDSCLKEYGLVVGADWQAGYFCSHEIPYGVEGTLEGHGHWKNVDVPDQSNINFLELVPIKLAIERYADSWADRHVIVFTDNTQVLCMINKGISANDDCKSYIRDIFWSLARNNIYLTALHIPGVMNVLPDMLSRIQNNNSVSHLINFGLCCR